MKNFIKFFRVDLRRLCCGYAWYIGIIGVTVFLFFSLERAGLQNGNVITTYVMATNLSGVLITYVFCAFPYAAVFSEDLEHKYVRYALVRGDLKSYVLSKTVMIYLSSMITMMFGTFLFLMLCRTQVPWVDREYDNFEPIVAGCYENFTQKGKYLQYCMLYALHMGMLAGFLSIFAAFCSIYISNRVMIFVLPVLLFQILTTFNFGGYDIRIFYASVKIFRNDWQNLIFIFVLSFVPSAILTAAIFQSLKKRL